MTLITPALLRTVTTPTLATKWCDALNETCERFVIDSPFRIAGFISNVAHESAGFKVVTENLNYSAQALCRVWSGRFAKVDAKGEKIIDADGKYIPNELAQAYAMQPEKIANYVYANRMGNGDEASGEGYFYRGRGLIQLTGKNNFLEYSFTCDNEAYQRPDIVTEDHYAAEAAGWYWDRNNLNALADKQDIGGMRRRINGGYNGLDDAQIKYAKIMDYFNQAR
jgi:putative chitinase